MHRDTQGCSHEQCAGVQDGCEVHRNLAAGQDIKVVEIDPADPVADLEAAMALAGKEAGARLGEHMLLSWYDRDRDFESPSTQASAMRRARSLGTWTMASITAPR